MARIRSKPKKCENPYCNNLRDTVRQKMSKYCKACAHIRLAGYNVGWHRAKSKFNHTGGI